MLQTEVTDTLRSMSAEGSAPGDLVLPSPLAPLDSLRTIFQQHWWLDAVAEGRWGEVVVKSDGLVKGCYPYKIDKSFGVKLSRMPPFTSTLGPIIHLRDGKPQTRLMNEASVLSELLEQLPRTDVFKHIMDHNFGNPVGFQAHGFRVGILPTLVISGRSPIKVAWQGLRDTTRRLIRRAQERLAIVEMQDPEEFSAFYLKNIERSGQQNDSFYDFSRFSRLYGACQSRGQGRILAAIDDAGKRHAAAFFVWDKFSIHYLVATRDPNNADLGAMNLLFWTGIQHAHDLGIDMVEGVSSRARWNFLVGFGGTLSARLVARRASTPLAMLLAARSALRQGAWSKKSLFVT